MRKFIFKSIDPNMVSAGDVLTVYSVVSEQVTSLSPMLISMDTAAVADPETRAPCTRSLPTLLRARLHQASASTLP